MFWDAITLVTVGVALLTMLAAAACTALVAHHAVSDIRQRRHDRRTQNALMLLAPAIVTGVEVVDLARVAVRRFGKPATAEVLRRARNDLAGECAAALTSGLEAIGEVQDLARMARSARSWRRRDAVRRLGECGGDLARDALVGALEDHDWEVRRAARDGLLADGRDEPIRLALRSYLAESAKSPGWRRSFWARFALVSPGHLASVLRDGTLPADEQKLAIDALGHARAREAAPTVRPLLESSDPELRASAARFAGKVDDVASVGGLVRLLRDPEWFVRAAAARGLETVPKSDDALDALAACLEDGTWWVRANAARTLARAGERGRHVLLDAIGRDDAYARDAAIAALATVRVGSRAAGTPRLEIHAC